MKVYWKVPAFLGCGLRGTYTHNKKGKDNGWHSHDQKKKWAIQHTMCLCIIYEQKPIDNNQPLKNE